VVLGRARRASAIQTRRRPTSTTETTVAPWSSGASAGLDGTRRAEPVAGVTAGGQSKLAQRLNASS
jgi:hypothetical protein